MAVAKELTSNSWILETNTGDKLGIVSYNTESEKYRIISESDNIEFDSMEQFEIMIDERIRIDAREITAVAFKDIDGWPISHETPLDVTHLPCGRITYKSSKRQDKLFYAGIWVIPDGGVRGLWATRTGLSLQVYDRLVSEGVEPRGPFKDKMEALFAAVQAGK